MKIFDIYETKEVKVEDLGLKRVINLDEKLILRSRGRMTDKFGKTRVNVIERVINYLGVPGHRGKKHKVMTNWSSGKYSKNAKTVLEALRIIQEKTQQNPVQVLVKAIENSAPRDEITTIEYGGARYPQAVDASPVRRVALALRHMVHGAYDKAFGKKASMAEALAQEIIKAYENSNESFAVQKRIETEKQADSAR
jgi:small subunit ribosomal protein S7